MDLKGHPKAPFDQLTDEECWECINAFPRNQWDSRSEAVAAPELGIALVGDAAHGVYSTMGQVCVCFGVFARLCVWVMINVSCVD